MVQDDDYGRIRLQQIVNNISNTNEYTYRIMTLFQAYTTGFGIGLVSLYIGLFKLNSGLPMAAPIRFLASLASLVNLLLLLSLVSNVRAWWQYRLEEKELVDRLVARGHRKGPSWEGVYYWTETWVCLAILMVTALMWLAVELILIPSAQ